MTDVVNILFWTNKILIGGILFVALIGLILYLNWRANKRNHQDWGGEGE